MGLVEISLIRFQEEMPQIPDSENCIKGIQNAWYRFREEMPEHSEKIIGWAPWVLEAH